jgi:phage terminase large subunit-like protein
MSERSLLEEAIEEAGGPVAFEALLTMLPPEERTCLAFDWSLLARPSQLIPPGSWRSWLVLAGRGFGKSRTGAEFIRGEVEAGRARRISLVGPTAADARDVMVEGPSGILAVSPPHWRPHFEPSKRRVTWPNGAIATLFSADEPERLRGPQSDCAWCDELAAYHDPDEVWAQLQLGLRIGENPRAIVTTTPRPIALLRRLVVDPSVHVVRGRTFDNAAQLAPGFLAAITKQYGGTRLGRQELDAELLEDNPGALWRLSQIDAARVRVAPALQRIVVAVDPAVSTNARSDETGIIVAGVGMCSCKGTPEIHAFVLEDVSGVHSPAGWAQATRSAYVRHRADRVIAEKNQGGDLVESNLRANGGDNLPLRTVHASVGKRLRAEPVASLYERGIVHHVGGFAKLEDQCTQWDPAGGESPDRVDALVYALTELMVQAIAPPAPTFCRPDRPILPRRR